MQKNLNVAVIQMVSSHNVADNLNAAQKYIAQAAEQGADWVLLPEYWAIMGQHDTDKIAIAEPFGQGQLQRAMSQWAKQYQIILFGGSIPLQSHENNKIFNTMLVYGRDGDCVSRYDKIHLFGYQNDKEHYAESNTIIAGNTLPQLKIDGWRVAQGICYDLRFPEFFRLQQPFDVILLPAAFTHTTGMAHWELLLRARAVENQCYVIASGQGGKHSNGRRTFGHSMIIDPWGEVVAMLPENAGVVMAQIQAQRVAEVREKLPALQHIILK